MPDGGIIMREAVVLPDHFDMAAFPIGANDVQVDAWSQGAKRLLTIR